MKRERSGILYIYTQIDCWGRLEIKYKILPDFQVIYVKHAGNYEDCWGSYWKFGCITSLIFKVFTETTFDLPKTEMTIKPFAPPQLIFIL